MASHEFGPTHELFDATGESRGVYRDCGDHYVDSDCWYDGGRVLFVLEMLDWGWTARSLTDQFREHYAAWHASDHSECAGNCFVDAGI